MGGGGGTLYFTPNITGSVGLTVGDQGGSVILPGSNTYSGNTTVSSGTLQNSPGGQLPSANAYVGLGGTATLAQWGGTSTISSSGNLYLGYNAADSGTYSLSGSGLLSAPNNEYIGNSGNGTMLQSGGVNTMGGGQFYLGNNTGSFGSYNLSGGSCSAANGYIGNSGTGSFTQSGGTLAVSNRLWIGDNTYGSYSLSGGLLLGYRKEYVGNAGSNSGIFTQSGGTNAVSGWLMIGTQDNSNGYPFIGTYNLSGGSLYLRGLRHGVERVGDDDEDAVRRMLHHLADYVAHDFEVGVQKVIAAHSRLAWNSRGDDDNVGLGCVGVVVGAEDVESRFSIGMAWSRSRPLPWGTPSIMSMRTTSASSFAAIQ